LTSLKIVVLGCGANGASISADLVRAGLDVVLIEQWPEHIEAMRVSGLRIEMPDETLEVPVRVFNLCEVCTLNDQFDIVLLLMKAYDTRWACQLIEPYLKNNGLVVAVQNGMTTDTVADIVGTERTMGSVIEISAALFEPGTVERHTPPSNSWFAVGAVDPRAMDQAGQIAELLEHSGTVEITGDIQAAKWMKLVSNCSTLALPAILGLPTIEALRHPGMRELMLLAGQEALDAGAASGYPIKPIFGLTVEDMRQPERVVGVLLDKICASYALPHTTSTVLQDWRKGRRSEVGQINGIVVRECARQGRSAPINAGIVNIARAIERHELRPTPDNLPMLTQLADAVSEK